MILYPTETVYGLGVNALDMDELQKLYDLKGRNAEKHVNWIVCDLEDIKKYAEVGSMATKIVSQFLPGPITIVLPLKKEILETYPFLNRTVGFRISSDPVAQKVVSDFMEECGVPLTSTSANISGLPTQRTVPEILKQFGTKKNIIKTIVDGGIRKGLPSTVVEVKNEQLIIHREGQVSPNDIKGAI